MNAASLRPTPLPPQADLERRRAIVRAVRACGNSALARRLARRYAKLDKMASSCPNAGQSSSPPPSTAESDHGESSSDDSGGGDDDPPGPEPPSQQIWLSVRQVAQLLPFSEQSVRWLIFADVDGFASSCVTRRARRVLVNRAALDRWLDEGRLEGER